MQKLIGGDSLDWKSGGMAKIQARWNGQNSTGSSCGVFSIATIRNGRNPCPNLWRGYTCTQRDDCSRDLETQRCGHVRTGQIGPLALTEISIIDTSSRNLNQDLTRLWCGLFHLFQMHHFRPTCLMNTDGFQITFPFPLALPHFV